MPVEKSGIGEIDTILGEEVAPRRSGDRPEVRPVGQEGLRVVMMREAGLTPNKILGHPFLFQVPPLDEIEMSRDFGWTDSETITHDVLSKPLRFTPQTLTFRSMFFDTESMFGVGSAANGAPLYNPFWSVVAPVQGTNAWAPRPSEMIQELHEIMARASVFRLLAWLPENENLRVSVSTYEVNMLATLRSISRRLVAGENDTVYFNVTFVEYRQSEVSKLLYVSDKLPARQRVATLPDALSTLGKLAKFYYGDPGKWTVIRKANGLTNVGQKDDLRTRLKGERVLKIPALPPEKKASTPAKKG